MSAEKHSDNTASVYPTNAHSKSVQTVRTAKSLEQTSQGCQATPDFLPPTMLEVLGEHLYAKIEEVQGVYRVDLDVAKITGVLLELGEEQVLKLLQDEKLLQQSVKRVVQHVPAVCSNIRHWSLLARDDAEEIQMPQWQKDEETDPDDAEQLYEQVFQLEPQLSTNITGMLLELGGSEVKSLLQSPSRLKEAVTRAKAVYFQSHSPSHNLPYERENMVPHKFLMSPNTAGEMSSPNYRLNEDCFVTERDKRNREHMAAECDQKCRENHGGESMAGQDSQKCSDFVSNISSAEEMGEMVYAEAENLYPESAAKLTGMVLDMGETRVQKLLQDRAQLHRAITMAFTSLSYSNR